MQEPRAISVEDRSAISGYFAAQPAVKAAFLFGSQARGNIHPGSDVDIGVLLKRDAPTDPLLPVSFTNDLMDILDRSDVDVVILNDASPLLVHRVARKADVLFATSSTVVAEFIIGAMQQFEDTRPLRELQAKQTRRIFESVGHDRK